MKILRPSESMCATQSQRAVKPTIQTLWNTVWRNLRNRTIVGSPNPTSGSICEGKEITIWERSLQAHVHGSIVHRRQDLGATYVSTGRWIEKETWCVYEAVLFCRNKKEIPLLAAAWMDLGALGWDEPDEERHTAWSPSGVES